MKSKKIPLESIGSAIFSFFNETIAYKRSSEPYSILYFLNGVEIHRIERVCTSKIKLLQNLFVNNFRLNGLLLSFAVTV